MRTIKREEYTYQWRRVILDACELSPGHYEVMLLARSTGDDIASATAYSEAEALAAFDRIREAHRPDQEQPAPLTGKYAKLRDDLRAALAVGRAAEEAAPSDGGASNFDSPALRLPRWSRAKVEQAAREAGSSCFIWDLYGSKRYVFRPYTRAQGIARSLNAEAATDELRRLGYEAFSYCQMD